MNRSFMRTSQESPSQMKMAAAAAVKQRQQLRASLMKEKKKEEEEQQLSLFLDMKKRENEHHNHLLLSQHDDDEFYAPLGSKHGNRPMFSISSATAAAATMPPARKVSSSADDFLNSENDKNDYDWLLTPPGTPLFPSLEVDSQNTIMSQIGATQKARPTSLRSRLANPEPATRASSVSRQSALSPGLNSSGSGIRRPSSSGGPGSRTATSAGRPNLTPASKPSRSSTPTSRTTLPSSRSSVTATKPSISVAMPSSTTKPAVPARSSTPIRSTARSSTPARSTAMSSTPTPIARPAAVPLSKSTSRASTPTRRPSTPASAPSISAPPIKSSPSVTRAALRTVRQPAPSRGTSPTLKPRPWKPSEMPGFSLDAPPNLRTTLPERSLSATRGRPGAPSSRSSSVEPTPNGRPRRQSCSPARGRAPNGIMHPSGSSVPAISRLHAKANDNVSPVVIGTKMVERVVNMRKLAPPKQGDKPSPHSNLSGKSSSPDSSGFGRTLSKKSLDMAIRHMDIRRSIPGNLRPLMTNIPASSMYSVRSGSTRSRTISVSDSPLATSSNASSELSVNNNGLCLDGIELEDDVGSERGGRSPLRGR